MFSLPEVLGLIQVCSYSLVGSSSGLFSRLQGVKERASTRTSHLTSHDVTVTVAGDGGTLLRPAELATAAEKAASGRSRIVMSAHTAGQIIRIDTVQTVDRRAARDRRPGRHL
jgi:hypothetical protein